MRPPIDLNLLRAFVAVYDTGSLVAAGTKLNVPRSTLSRAIATLEQSLGVTLFQRTTRSVSPTNAATALYERVAAKVASLNASFGDLPDGAVEPSGTLRVTATPEFGAMVLAEAVTRFAQRYPKVLVEVKLSTTFVDLVKENIDVAIRLAGKPLRDSTLVARKIGTVAADLYASPSYLARRGTPRSPADFDKHEWVEFIGSPPLPPADGMRRPRSGKKLGASSRIITDSLWFLRETLRAGGGLGQLPSFLADPDVAAGNLVPVMPRRAVLSGTVYFVYPASKHTPPRVTAFRDLLVEMLRQRPLGA